VLRWHGRTGTSASAECAKSLREFQVLLLGTPLDAADLPAVHARLSQDGWAQELVSSVVVHGIWPGRGQLWPPDPFARVSTGDSQVGGDGHVRQRGLRVATCLTAEEVRYRLLVALSEDRLVAVEIPEQGN
jgi:hypothetical protein